MNRLTAWTFLLLLVGGAGGQGSSAPPRELGTISWMRSEAEACASAKQRNRPLLVLFQEVPG